MSVSSAWRQEAPRGGRHAGWGLGACADGEDHSVRGIHAPLTCYCELPAALADNCHLSQGKQSKAGIETAILCLPLLLTLRSPGPSPALNPGG